MQPIGQSVAASAAQFSLKLTQSANAVLRLSQPRVVKTRPLPQQSFVTPPRRVPSFNGFSALNSLALRDEEDGLAFPSLGSTPPFSSNPFLSPLELPRTPPPLAGATSSTGGGFLDMREVAGQLPSFDSGMDVSQDARKSSKASAASAVETKNVAQQQTQEEGTEEMLDSLDTFEDGLNEDYEDAATKIARVLVQAHEQGLDSDAMSTQMAVSQLR